MAKKSVETRAAEALKLAVQKIDAGLPWQDVHNALFGIGGFCAVNFTDVKDRLKFTKSEQYSQIMALLSSMTDQGVLREIEASGKLLVRLPRSLHASLIAEAELEQTSVNQLVVAKLSAQLRQLASR